MPRWTEELGAFALDRGGNITLASPLAESIAGVDLRALLSQHYLAFIDAADESEARAIFEKALGGQSLQGTRTIVLGDGAHVLVGYTIQPDRRSDGEIVGVTGTVWMER